MRRRNLKEYYKEKGYTDEQIQNHYNFIKRTNDRNKERYKEIELEYKEDIELAKKYFKKVKPSLKGDGLWLDNTYGRLFVYWEDLQFYINEEIKLGQNKI